MYYVLSLQNKQRKSSSICPFVSEQVIDTLPAKSTGEHVYVEFRHERIAKNEMICRSQAFYQFMNQRRTLRFFSTDPVPIEVIQNCVLTAGTAPSGAHCQPWTFVIVKDKIIKTQLREVIENEERVNYDHRMNSDWIKDLGPLMGTLHVENEIVKPYIEEAPYIIIVLKQQYGLKNGKRIAHYYPMESVCIATGILLTAIHNANLVSLVSTPMGAENAIRSLCNRPDNERVLFFMPVGYPADNATVPYRNDEYLRKSIEDILYIV
ncbi:hypothetical protein LOD99_3602 [Oopsacas minuta]|uniref:Nitroreductase domain-containing protein n=1 Tax=Oopsacas minuta TaxID=111878 RepID=A0AAV7JWJ6_9METZ|nr:hypothetical protein LOD99_3602 [Oopsacas minuta]